MRPGDFTALAQAYAHRPAYADAVVDTLLQRTRPQRVADVGAGTGKLTAMLGRRGLGGVAVEPNAAMRAEGERLDLPGFGWRDGRAEATGLDAASFDWVTMASAFHWAEPEAALSEFRRILKPGGFLTLMWNPRDLARDALQSRIEARIRVLAPEIRRRSSGAAAYTETLEDLLLASGGFGDLVFVEAPHTEVMSRARHLAAWRSVNDVRAQAGEEVWSRILEAIEAETADLDPIEVRYRTRAWTVGRL